MLLIEAFLRGLHLEALPVWASCLHVLVLSVASGLSKTLAPLRFLKLVLVLPATITLSGMYVLCVDAPSVQGAMMAIWIACVTVPMAAIAYLLAERASLAELRRNAS